MPGADPDLGLDEGARKEQLWWWTYNKPRQFGALLRTHATRYLLEHQSAPYAPTPQAAGGRTLTGGTPHVPPAWLKLPHSPPCNERPAARAEARGRVAICSDRDRESATSPLDAPQQTAKKCVHYRLPDAAVLPTHRNVFTRAVAFVGRLAS
jgi:hypothetical protein